MGCRRFIASVSVLLAVLYSADVLAADSAEQLWLVHLHPPVRLSREPEPSLQLLPRAHRREHVHQRCLATVRDAQRAAIEFLGSKPWQQHSSNASVALKITPLWVQNVLLVAAREDELVAVEPFLSSSLRWFPGVVDVIKDTQAPWKLLQPTHSHAHDSVNGSNVSPQHNVKLLARQSFGPQASEATASRSPVLTRVCDTHTTHCTRRSEAVIRARPSIAIAV
ncbi:hypothetical protein PINS_up021222 [Pythium insidiosum]|nr:hypothetical protein PINS_up021222 [Pythium insidiosum]